MRDSLKMFSLKCGKTEVKQPGEITVKLYEATPQMIAQKLTSSGHLKMKPSVQLNGESCWLFYIDDTKQMRDENKFGSVYDKTCKKDPNP